MIKENQLINPKTLYESNLRSIAKIALDLEKVAEKIIDCVNKVLKLDLILQDEERDIIYMLDLMS